MDAICKHCSRRLYDLGMVCYECKARICPKCVIFKSEGGFFSKTRAYCLDCASDAPGKIISGQS